MSLGVIPGGILPVIGAILIVLLGLAVLLVRPHRRLQYAFAVYAVTFGLATGISRFTSPESRWFDGLAWSAVAGFISVSAAALAWMARLQVRELGVPPGSGHALVGGTLLVGGAWTAMALTWSEGPATATAYGTQWTAASDVGWCALVGFTAVSFAVAVGLARAGGHSDLRGLRQAALMSTAIAIFPSFFVPTFLYFPTRFGQVAGWVAITGAAWLSITWLALIPRCRRPRLARNAALAPLALALAGSVAFLAGVGGAGLARIATVAFVAYAIVRHHALGIDAKIRFGISKGALAALIVGAFFVASEAAQQFFGERFNNTYIGIAAAGLLVVGISPLQRFADSVAHRALPVREGAVDDAARTRNLRDYRLTYRAAVRDGKITQAEELALARLATSLGLGAADVVRISQETARGGDAALHGQKPATTQVRRP